MSQRLRVVVTENSSELLPDGHYRYAYPTSFMCASGIKKVIVSNAYVYNATELKFDVSFSLHADFAFEADNRYDGYVSLTNFNFKSKDYDVIGNPQFFYFWFKFLSSTTVDFTNYRFIIELDLYY